MERFVFCLYQKWNSLLHGYINQEEKEYLSDKFILYYTLSDMTMYRVNNIFNLIE
jgi:hypothetical protein